MNSTGMDWELLRTVSRSFYLSLKFLPIEIRDSVALAYLLARATDTLADCGNVSPEERMEAMEAFRNEKWNSEIASVFQKQNFEQSEKQTIKNIPQMLATLQGNRDQDLIRSVLWKITSGQMLDIQWFELEKRNVLSREELEDYTYRVAGCVGEFWTEISFRHISAAATLPEEEMKSLGREYGKGLQLVNILRDRKKDRLAGRNYFSDEDYENVLKTAYAAMDAGRIYSETLRNRRLHFCTRLPYDLALQTLRGIEVSPHAKNFRISRGSVYFTMARNLLRSIIR